MDRYPASPNDATGSKVRADEWNTDWHEDVSVVAEQYTKFQETCTIVGRDPATIDLTVGTRVYMGRDEAPSNYTGIKGSPDEIAATLKKFANAGVKHLVVQIEPLGVESKERFSPIAELLDLGES